MGFSDRPSHVGPDGPVPLSVHLDDVVERTAALVPEDAETPAGGSLRDLTRTVARLHDFGKLTEWFRDHLLKGDRSASDNPSHHAPLGALVAQYALSVRGFDGSDSLIGFLAVARHHGRLPDAADYVEDAAAAPSGRLAKLYREETLTQIEHLDDTVPDLADELIRDATEGHGSWAEFRDQVLTARSSNEFDWIAEHACRGILLQAAPEMLPEDLYAATLQVWSALVLADKTSAKQLTTGAAVGVSAYQSKLPNRSAIDDHVAELQAENAASDLDERTERMNAARERARVNIRRRAEQFAASDRRVATLTLPTGMGKTLSGLDAALTVLDEADGGRLVYALPYTSIIDQVAAVSRDVFGIEDGARQSLVTVDHHLSETVVSFDESAEEILDDTREEIAALLGESWRSGMVVTTFVQLFESLAGPSNARSMKLPALYDSVVVLDEPQALPLEWWPLVDRLVEILTERYGASVIAMTATQPRLFTDGEREPVELVDDPDGYYGVLDRLSFELHPSAETMLPGGPEPTPLGYPQAAEAIADRAADRASVLSICNTIDSARELADAVETRTAATNVNEVYEMRLSDVTPSDTEEMPDRDAWSTALSPADTAAAALSRRSGSGDNPLLISLTTRHRPCDRAHLIDVAKALTEAGEPVVFVSTQLVEAGVDVSFDEVFRDFAPMDSVVQAAGRCNRSFDRDRGRVTVWLLEPPEGRSEPPARAVYGLVGESLTKVTAQALSTVYDGEPVSEPAVTRDAVMEYFGILDDRGIGSQSYVEYVDRAEAQKLGDLSLLDERRAADVVVARTDAEAKLRGRIQTAFREHRWDDVDALVDSARELQVSVPLYPGDDETAEKLVHLNPLVPGGERLWLDGRPGHNDGYFDPTDGVVIPDTSAEARLL